MDMKRRRNRQLYFIQASKKPGSSKQHRLKMLIQREAIALAQLEINKLKHGGDLFFFMSKSASTGRLKRKMIKVMTHQRGNYQEVVLASKKELCLDVMDDGKDLIHVRILEAEHMCELIFTGTNSEILESFVEPLIEVVQEYIIKPESWELLSEVWN